MSAYDPAKVTAWLELVKTDSKTAWDVVWPVLSPWEKVNAMYGFRDMAAAIMTADIAKWTKLAREADDEAG